MSSTMYGTWMVTFILLLNDTVLDPISVEWKLSESEVKDDPREVAEHTEASSESDLPPLRRLVRRIFISEARELSLAMKVDMVLLQLSLL